MATTSYEFGYLFGGVKNVSFDDKFLAMRQAHHQGYSYIVERTEVPTDREPVVELKLIAWGFIQVMNKANLAEQFANKPSTAAQIKDREDDEEKKYVYCAYDNTIANWDDKRNFMEADAFKSIEIIPKETLKKFIYG